MHRLSRIVLALTIAAAFALQASADDTIHRNFSAADGGTLILESDLGKIDVTTGGTGVAIEVVRTTRGGGNDVLKRNDITFEQNGNEIRVRSRYDHDFGFFSFGNELRLKFNVRVPARFNVNLVTSGGSIHVGDLNGTVDVKTSGGSIHLAKTNGPVHAKTSGGSITLQSATGTVEARTSGGSIEIENAENSVDAKTSGGSIEIRHVAGPAILRTSGGHIEVENALNALDAATSGGSIAATFSRQPQRDSKLVTSGGSIRVRVAPGLHLDLDAHASGGGVTSEVPVTVVGTVGKSSLSGKLNGGGPRLEARTSGGNVTVMGQ